MDLIVSIFSGAQAHMLIAFSKVKERAICQCNHRISSSSPSISKRPGALGLSVRESLLLLADEVIE